jgi:hypothetical protein
MGPPGRSIGFSGLCVSERKTSGSSAYRHGRGEDAHRHRARGPAGPTAGCWWSAPSRSPLCGEAEIRRWWPRSDTPIVLDLSQGSHQAQGGGSWGPTWGGPTCLSLVAEVNYDAFWREPLRSAILRARFDLRGLRREPPAEDAPGGKASLFAAFLRDRIPHGLALTGTPMPHSPLDIYAQYRALDVSVFGRSFAAFKRPLRRHGRV